MRYSPIWPLLLLAVLSGCQSVPIDQAEGGIKTLFVYPQPSCIVICTSSISAIREDVDSRGAVTTGAKTSTQTSHSPK